MLLNNGADRGSAQRFSRQGAEAATQAKAAGFLTQCNFNQNPLRFTTARWKCVEQTWDWRGCVETFECCPEAGASVLAHPLPLRVWCRSLFCDFYVGM